MATATNAQVQSYCDVRLRPRMEQSRGLIASLRDDVVAIPDVFANVNNAGSTFADSRTDGPPRLLTRQDVLSYNSFAVLLLKCIDGTATLADIANLNANWLIVQNACVRPLGA